METFAATMPTILCCMCGIDILQNPSNMCVTCLRASVDITAGIPRQLTIHSCRTCERWAFTDEGKVYLLTALWCCYCHTHDNFSGSYTELMTVSGIHLYLLCSTQIFVSPMAESTVREQGTHGSMSEKNSGTLQSQTDRWRPSKIWSCIWDSTTLKELAAYFCFRNWDYTVSMPPMSDRS